MYLSTHASDLARYGSAVVAHLEEGKAVGELATQLFPGGVRLEYDYQQVPDALRRTRELMADPLVPALFEAAFRHEGVLVFVDILKRRSGGGWEILEVKKAGEVKDEYYPDVAIQYYVTRGAGVDVRSAGLMRLNTQYVYDGLKLDCEQLFVCQDLTEQVVEWQKQIPDLLRQQYAILSGEMPLVEPGPRCEEWGGGCPYWECCTEGKPKHWIYHLPNAKKVFADLVARGIETVDTIPDEFSLNDLQRRVRECVRSGAPFIDPVLKEAVSIKEYPIHYLDFETIMPAIPLFAGTRPYQQIPFQWSVQTIGEKGGTPEERAYLCKDGGDPRRELAVSLLEALREPGPIYMWTHFENTRLVELADQLPDLSPEIEKLRRRLVDLKPPVKERYYHPDQKGSFSLKALVPALLPEMDYSDLEIQGGDQAGPVYLRMVSPECPPEE
ncbi:MAG: DUF2779 domain-containing protein, partial [Nitrospirae bacterium]|nr:DUF2779 domain-containing protein [Nitrospirota bacterium]